MMKQERDFRDDGNAIHGMFWGILFSLPLWGLIIYMFFA